MARNTDTRVVQMQFDNKNFEKNIATSGNSLEKFKRLLNFDKVEDGLSRFQSSIKNLTFESLASNIQKLTDKFTGLGNVGEMVISQLRGHIESLVSKMSNLVDSLGMEQVTAGLDKYGQMNKNVQSIMAATGRSQEEVYEVLGRLNEYTDQTSYNFTDMAANIGKFTSVGIPLEKAEKQMEGIANWAARSGAGINEASRAMYNLSQAMGVGSLKLMDWKSIENAGMATKEFKEQLIEAGIAAGTLERDSQTGVVKTAKSLGKQVEVNFQNVSSTLQKGWANSQVLGDTLERYYWEDLYYEGKEALIKLDEEQKKAVDKMLADGKINQADWKSLEARGIAIDDTKQKLLDLAVSNGKVTKEVGEDGTIMYKAIDKNNKEIQFSIDDFEKSLTAGWLDKSLMDNATSVNEFARECYEAAQKCTTLTDVLGAWKDQLSTGWMKAWQQVFGDLGEAMELFSAICNKVGDSFSEFIETLVGGGEKDLPGILGAWANLGGRDTLWSMIVGEYDGLYEGAYGLLDVLKDIGDIISGAFWDLQYTIYSVLTENPMSKEEWSLNEQFRQEFVGGQIEKVVENIKSFVQGIHDFLEAVPEGSGKSRIQMIRDIVSGITHAFLIAYTAVRDTINFFKAVVARLRPSFDAILGLFSSLGIGVQNTAKTALKGGGLKVIFDDILNTIQPLIDAFNDLILTIVRIFSTFNESGQAGEAFKSIWNAIRDTIQVVAKVVVRVGKPVIEFLGTLFTTIYDLFSGGFSTDKLADAGTKIKNAFKAMVNAIFGFDITGKLEAIVGSVKNVFTSGFSSESIKDLSEKIKAFFKEIFNKLPAGVKSGIKQAFNRIKNFFKPFVDDVINLFKNGFSKESLKKLGDRFKTMFNAIWAKMPDGVKEGITNAFNKIKAFFAPIVEKIKQIFGPVWESIRTFFGKLFGFFGNFGQEMKTTLEGANLFTLIKESLGLGVLSKFLGGLTSIVKGTNLYAIAMSFLGGYALIKLIKMLKTGGGAFGSIKTFFGGLNEVLTGKKSLKDVIFGTKKLEPQTENFGDKILKIGAGIALIVASLTVMALLPLNKLAQGVIALGVVLALILGFLAIFKKIAANLKQITSMIGTLFALGTAILMISLGIAIITLALKPLGKMAWGDLAKMGVALVVIVGVLLVFTKKASYMKGSGMGSLVMVALSIFLVVRSLLPLASIEWGGLAKMGAGLVLLAAVLIIFTKKVALIKGAGMGQLLIVAASIWLLVKALTPLAEYSWGDLGKIAAGLVVLIAALMFVTHHAGSMKDTGMGQLLSVVGSIWTILESLKPLATYSWEALGKMGAGLTALLVLLIMFTQGTKSMKNTGMLQLVMVAASIWLLLEALKPLAEYSWESLAKMAAGMTFMMLIVVVMSRFMKTIGNVREGTGTLIVLVGFAAIILSFALAMSMLKDVKWDTIVVSTLAIILVLATFMLLIKQLKTMKVKDMAKAITFIGMMLSLCAVMVVFALAVKMIKDINPDKIVAFALGLSVIIVAMAAAIAVLSLIKDPGAMFIAIAAIAAGIVAVIGAISLMLPVLSSSLGSAITSMAASLTIFSNLFSNFSNNMNETSEDDLQSAKRKFEILIDICKTCIGIEQYYGAISLFEQAMLKLGTGVSLFTSSSSNVGDPENSNAIKTIKAFLAMKDDFAGFSVGNIAVEIFKLGEGLSLFSFVTTTASEDAPGLKMLRSLAAEADNLKKLSELNGAALKTNLSGLGGALSIYAEGASEASMIEGGKMPDIQKAVELMHAVTQSFSGENGAFVIPDIPDESELSGFGADIAALAIALKKFANASQGLTNTDKAKEILTFMQTLKTDLRESDLSVISVFKDANVSEETLASFGLEIAALGDALAKYDQSVANFKGNQNAYDALTFFKQLKEDLQASDIQATISSFDALGENGDSVTSVLTEFGTNIGELGTALSSFADNVNFGDDKQSKFDAAIKSLESIRTIANTLPVIGGLSGLIHGNVITLDRMAKDIAEIGSALKGFSDALTLTGENQKEFDVEVVGAGIEALNAFASLAYFMSKGDYHDPENSLFENLYTLTEFMYQLNKNESGMYEGKSVVQSLAEFLVGIEGAIEAAGGISHMNYFAAFKNVAESISALASIDPSLNFEGIGMNIVKGIQNGITNGKSEVINSVIEMVKETIQAAKDTAKIKSPSRVFMQMGGYITKGLALGIDAGSSEPEKAASNMIDNIITKGPFNNLSALLAGEIDPNPTISPILDLSNVATGVQGINQLFGSAFGLGLFGGALTLNPSGTNMMATLANPIDYTTSLDNIRMDITNLRSDLRIMANAVNNMKFVFDSGAVVAAIGPQMDEYLGRQGFYAARTEIP